MASHELDQLYVKNPTDFPKTVKWGGIDYTLGPGQQIIWQRFLAEHFAKHLANDILLLKEKAHKDKYVAGGGHMADYKPVAYVNSKKHRPPVVASILTGVYNYYQPQKAADPNLAAQQELDRLNREQQGIKEPPATDIGVVNDDRTGAEVRTPYDADDEDEAGAAPHPATQTPVEVTPMQQMPQPPAPQQPPAQLGTPAPMGVPTVPPMTAPVDAPAATAPPQNPPEAPGAADDRKMPALLKEAEKLGIKVPFGSTKEQVKQLIAENFG